MEPNSVDVTSAVRAVRQLEHDLGHRVQRRDLLAVLDDWIRAETVQPMVDAMSPTLRQGFLDAARHRFVAFDSMIAYDRLRGRDPTCLLVLREWLYHQPFDVDASRPFPTYDESFLLPEAQLFSRMLPHLHSGNVEDRLGELSDDWRGTFRRLVLGLRPGLPVILETALRRGQDTAPWHAVMEWLDDDVPYRIPPKPTSIPSALAAVARLEADLADLGPIWVRPFDTLLDEVSAETVGPMFEALSAESKERFLRDARSSLVDMQDRRETWIDMGMDVECLDAVRQWVYRQPWIVDPTLPPLTAQEVESSFVYADVFARLLPHARRDTMTALVAGLPAGWPKTLARMLAGMRPGLDTILATARTYGQSEEPWQALMDWEKMQPRRDLEFKKRLSKRGEIA